MQMQMLQQMTLFPETWRRQADERRRTARGARPAGTAGSRPADGRGRHGNSLAAHGSIEAALEGRRAEIVAWVDLHGPCTVRCINEGLFGKWADMDLTRPRVTELLAAGRLVELGKVPDHVTGRSVMTVDLAGRGSRLLCGACLSGLRVDGRNDADEGMQP